MQQQEENETSLSPTTTLTSRQRASSELINTTKNTTNNYSKNKLSTPINIITATYLNPKRYTKFFTIWIYLFFLYSLQYLQFIYINKNYKNFKKKLNYFINLLENYKNGNLIKYFWYSFKFDLFNQSIYSTLSIFSRSFFENREESVVLPNLVMLGASFTNKEIKNVVFLEQNLEQKENDFTKNVTKSLQHKSQEEQELLSLLENVTLYNNHTIDNPVDNTVPVDNVTKKSLEEITQEMSNDLISKFNTLQNLSKNTNYQTILAKEIPIWKNRFILSPNKLPKKELLQNTLQNDLQNNFETIKGEQYLEFSKYLFDDFLNIIDPYIDHELNSFTKNGNNKIWNKNRIKYILNDIEMDRKRIIKNAILSISNKEL